MKSTGVFDFPLMQVFCTLHDSAYRPIYDTNIDQARLIKKVACNTYFIYQKTKSMLGVSSRDFVLCHHVVQLSKKSVLIMAFTPNPEANELQPETKDALRGYCHVSIIRMSDNHSDTFLVWRLVARGDQSHTD